MIELRPVDPFVGVSPRPKILLPNYWVRFSDKFPENLDHVKGKTMRVEKQIQVTYELSWILKENCYKDINLSNEDAGEKLYPEASENVYEMLIGMKPGNYYIIPYFPADQPIYRLEYPDMTPVMTNRNYKYLGAVKPHESPVGHPDIPDNPTFKLYLVYKLKPVILRVVADEGVDYEKISLSFLINRCLMEEGTPPAEVVPKPIPYLDELKW